MTTNSSLAVDPKPASASNYPTGVFSLLLPCQVSITSTRYPHPLRNTDLARASSLSLPRTKTCSWPSSWFGLHLILYLIFQPILKLFLQIIPQASYYIRHRAFKQKSICWVQLPSTNLWSSLNLCRGSRKGGPQEISFSQKEKQNLNTCIFEKTLFPLIHRSPLAVHSPQDPGKCCDS